MAPIAAPSTQPVSNSSRASQPSPAATPTRALHRLARHGAEGPRRGRQPRAARRDRPHPHRRGGEVRRRPLAEALLATRVERKPSAKAAGLELIRTNSAVAPPVRKSCRLARTTWIARRAACRRTGRIRSSPSGGRENGREGSSHPVRLTGQYARSQASGSRSALVRSVADTATQPWTRPGGCRGAGCDPGTGCAPIPRGPK